MSCGLFPGHLPRFLLVTLEVGSCSGSCAGRERPWAWYGDPVTPPRPPDFLVSPHTPTFHTSSCCLWAEPHPAQCSGPVPLLGLSAHVAVEIQVDIFQARGSVNRGSTWWAFAKCH